MTTATAAPCTKISFGTEGEALRRLIEIAFLGEFRQGTKPVASYYCRECSAWHLTRRPR